MPTLECFKKKILIRILGMKKIQILDNNKKIGEEFVAEIADRRIKDSKKILKNKKVKMKQRKTKKNVEFKVWHCKRRIK